MNGRNIVINKEFNSPNTFPNPEFDKGSFQDSVWNKGYNVLHEKTIKCPCRYKSSDHLSSCQNCQGTGWVVLGAHQTKMVLTSLNSNTKYSIWSEQNLGTVQITADVSDGVSFMDKITVLDSSSTMSELLYPIEYNGNNFCYTIYKIKEVETIFLFQADNLPLKRLVGGEDFTISDNKVLLNIAVTAETRLSIRYKHNVVYGVIDLPHDVRNSPVTNINGQLESQEFPVTAIGRRFHYIIDNLNFSGDNIIDNS